jgi:hypothetical protein
LSPANPTDSRVTFTFLPQDTKEGYLFYKPKNFDLLGYRFALPERAREDTTDLQVIELHEENRCCLSPFGVDFKSDNLTFVTPTHELDTTLGLPKELQLFFQDKKFLPDSLENKSSQLQMEFAGVLIISLPNKGLNLYYQLWNQKQQKSANTLVLAPFTPDNKTPLMASIPKLDTRRLQELAELKVLGIGKIQELVEGLSTLVYPTRVMDVLGE